EVEQEGVDDESRREQHIPAQQQHEGAPVSPGTASLIRIRLAWLVSGAGHGPTISSHGRTVTSDVSAMTNVSRCRSTWIVAAIAALVTPAALGAQADTTAAESTLVRRHRLPPVVVTGTLSPFALEKFGMSRTVVSAAQLSAEPARAAVDVLRHVTGVHIDESTGPLGPTIIRIRGGEGDFTQVRGDGVPINENGGFFDAQGVTMVNVDRVEVVRRP